MASAQSTSIRRVRPAELARELGVSRQAIHGLVERGLLTKDAEGLIDIELARVAIEKRVRPSGKTAAAVSGPAMPPAPPPNLPAPVPPPSDQEVNPAAATSYHVARTLRESEEAKMARLKRQQLEGSLIEREPAVQAVWTAFRTLRDSAMPLGRRVAPKVATMTNVREITLLIDEAMREVLQSFSERTLASLASRMGGTPGAGPTDIAAATAEKDPQ